MTPDELDEISIRKLGLRIPSLHAKLPQLTAQDLKDLRDDPGAMLQRLRAHVVGAHLEILRTSPDHLTQFSYGYAIQDKALERLTKLALPASAVEAPRGVDARALPADELLALLAEWGTGTPPVVAEGDEP